MALVLGCDLGSSSIGCALIDTEKKILCAAMVRVFPEGVDRDQQGGELSKSEQRRIARGMRRDRDSRPALRRSRGAARDTPLFNIGTKDKKDTV